MVEMVHSNIDTGQKMGCPLCYANDNALFASDQRRSYYRCSECGLVFVDKAEFLSEIEEKKVYDQHQNNPGDAGYRIFLSRLFDPVLASIGAGDHGLDFGSGPGPTLSLMFEEAGCSMTIFDHFYANDASVWERSYDFISATEVVEHLHRPRFELDRLWRHLNYGGVLGVMTKMVRDVAAFSRWHYKNDSTHVCFFAPQTFEWLAHHWQAEIKFIGADVVMLRKECRSE
ncbi:MAG: class I SAM-dependent methyltransferase [Thermodesulfobacteriota bacterium]|nr:class I SAM-dependent methyltransferase [Thermodesulfobacteriota bacterium]